MKDIDHQELLDVLAHWKKARDSRLNKVERDENLRCAVDIAALLSENGVDVPGKLWKGKTP